MRTFIFCVVSVHFVTVASGDVVTLSTGEELTGIVLEQTPEVVRFQHPILGELILTSDHVTSVALQDGTSSPPPASSPTDAAADAPVPAEEQPAEAIPAATEPTSTWKTSLEFGSSGSGGNSETIDLRAAILINGETPSSRTVLDASYFYGESRGDRSSNKFTGGARNDWLLPESPWFYFAQGRYDLDEFQSWDYRYSAGGGVGYEFWDEDDFKLTGRIGLGGVREYGSDVDGIQPEAILGLDMSWKIADNQSLTAGATAFPRIDDSPLDDYRLRLLADWTLHLDKAKGLDLKFGVQDEYDSMTDADILHNDFKFYASLVLRF